MTHRVRASFIRTASEPRRSRWAREGYRRGMDHGSQGLAPGDADPVRARPGQGREPLAQDTRASSAPRRPIETLAMADSRPVPPAKVLVLLLAFLAYSGAQLLNDTLLAGPQGRAVLERMHMASNGWLEPVLVRSLVVLGAFLIAVLWIGRRRAADIGWR